MSRKPDTVLTWRKQNGSARNGWKAWATALDPEASMPPYYRIIQLRPGFPERRVELLKPCGGDTIPICTVSCFADAKTWAQSDYEKRLNQQKESS